MRRDNQIVRVWLPTVAAVVGVGTAVPAAIFAEPVVMGVAAGAASVAAIMGIRAYRHHDERRTHQGDRRRRRTAEGTYATR